MKCSVTISLVPEARGGPFIFWDDLRASIRQAAAIGFGGVEIFPPGPEAVSIEAVRGLLTDHNLTLAAMGTGAGWVKHQLTLTSGEQSIRERAEAFVRSIIDTAGALGAPAIIGSMQGRFGDGTTRESALGRLGDALNRLGEHAARVGTFLLYEPLNRYETNLCNSIVDAAELVRTIAGGNVKVLADLYHMNIEEADLPSAIRTAGKTIGHVHFVDSNRRPAGLGHLDYGPIVRALSAIGYEGYLSAEALPYPNPSAAAEQTINAFRFLRATNA